MLFGFCGILVAAANYEGARLRAGDDIHELLQLGREVGGGRVGDVDCDEAVGSPRVLSQIRLIKPRHLPVGHRRIQPAVARRDHPHPRFHRAALRRHRAPGHAVLARLR